MPALRILFSEFDRLVGHHRRYHKGELKSLTELAGYEVITINYFDILGVIPWLLVNRLFGSTQLNPTLANLYDTVGVPITRFIEGKIVVPFGKNLIMVAQKKMQQ